MVCKEVKAGRLSEPKGKIQRKAWTAKETARLYNAVENYGRDWMAVAKAVGGTRTNNYCRKKVQVEVKAGRLSEPKGQ